MKKEEMWDGCLFWAGRLLMGLGLIAVGFVAGALLI